MACGDEDGMVVQGPGWCHAVLDPAAQSLVHHCWHVCVGSLHLVLDELVEVC